MIYMVVIMNGH